MRKSLLDQLPLVPVAIDHDHARELAVISTVLDQLPEAVQLIYEDLCRGRKRRIDPSKGRGGMAAEQILRVVMLKQLTGLCYEDLAFHLADSNTYRAFCRFGFDRKVPDEATLQRNVKGVRAETWQAIHRLVALKAEQLGVETGKRARVDCTVVNSNIHHPTDSSLLWDSVRVLVRIMGQAEDKFGIDFHDHSRRAKRRAVGIMNAKTKADRSKLYRDLIKVTTKTVAQAAKVAECLDQVEAASVVEAALAQGFATELRHYGGLAGQVISQTERRIFGGQTLPPSEKVVSIFEPHTDIIIKDRRDTLYGHKICLTSGASGIVTDVVVLGGNPADSTLAVAMIERHKALFGQVPLQAAFDGGFASRDNLTSIKNLGVQDVAFSKRCRLDISDMAKSPRVYRQLKNFRAGIEAGISFLKRAFGLGRCLWRGFESFCAYVHASVVSCNLLLIARHVLAARKTA
jgi:IS5 family transposase